MNIHHATSFLGIPKIAQGNESIQDESIWITNGIKIGMQIPLKYKNQSQKQKEYGWQQLFHVLCMEVWNTAYSFRKYKKYMWCCDRLPFKVNA